MIMSMGWGGSLSSRVRFSGTDYLIIIKVVCPCTPLFVYLSSLCLLSHVDDFLVVSSWFGYRAKSHHNVI